MTSAHAAAAILLASGGSSTTTTTTTGNPLETLLPLILIFGLGYFLFLRPRSQAAKRQRDTLMELSAGDEVLTGAGIFGTVLDVEPDRVTLETAPGTRITVLRSTIARKIVDEPAVLDNEWDEHDEHEARDAFHEYAHEQDPEHEHTEGDADTDDEYDEGEDDDGDGDAHDAAQGSAEGHDADEDAEHDESSPPEHDGGAAGPGANGRAPAGEGQAPAPEAEAEEHNP